ncbi:MAG: CoA-binding protein [Bilophila wadsworthia]
MKKSPWKLDPLFTPRSIAVIGASPNGGAGSIVLRNMQRLGYTGTVYPINPKYKEIFGYPCYASLRDLPAPADCAAVLLGSRSLLPMLEEAHAAGVKGVWGFASGFAETGGEGRAMQRRIHDFCHESGLLFCGPNCVGCANITDKTCMYSGSRRRSAGDMASSPRAARCCWRTATPTAWPGSPPISPATKRPRLADSWTIWSTTTPRM